MRLRITHNMIAKYMFYLFRSRFSFSLTNNYGFAFNPFNKTTLAMI